MRRLICWLFGHKPSGKPHCELCEMLQEHGKTHYEVCDRCGEPEVLVERCGK